MDSITINPCPNCRIVIQNGTIRWTCDDYHPEVLARILSQEQKEPAPKDRPDNSQPSDNLER